ncbi:hypothetical protein ACFQI7_08430 [Paenibacillus allorhizosphaerae]|uniref:Uncharacterized protein n=1 Tax=Paenibacillus allorhizosphaerae TaxID=2849866 RepID=A0ABN7TM50_9BACL|nr:hypothetical protein [Paenibacillus allorhizosphaerae]CAG7639033.1 hypothetical protein PAECIP111802_02500 [Paenibacillus allorhizosphaerae]
MDQSFKAKTINALTKLLMDHYVFPETAANMSHDVTGRLNNNEYASINDFSLFAEIVTAQLQGILGISIYKCGIERKNRKPRKRKRIVRSIKIIT